MTTPEKKQYQYVETTAKIYFEPEHIACQYCPMLETYSRNQCRLTGEYITDTRYTVGGWCPLNINENIFEKERK